jgi:hypothetical protein
MSNELALFAVLCLIYVTDCVLWIGKQSFVFVTWVGRQWREMAASQVFRISEGGILLLNPFPPLGGVICCHLPPLSISPAGICSLNSQALTDSGYPEQNVVAAPFEEISSIRVGGRDVLVNEERFCRCSDTQQANRISSLINALLDATAEEREITIQQFWDEQFDYRAARARFEQAVHQMTPLRMLCNILFVHLFALAPALVLYFGMTGMLIPLALGMLAIAVQISVGFYRLHKRLYPAEGEERISNLIKMILCPPTSLRACDLLTEGLLSNYNPLVVGHLLLSDNQYREFSIRTLRNLKYPPVDHSADRRTYEISRWQNQTLLRKASDYLREMANLQEELLFPPLPNEPDVRAYCPRCLSQFIREEGNCSDCPGVKLIPFGGAA